MLLLGPLAITYYFGWRRRFENRVLIGGLFSFLYGLGTLLPAHVLAIQAGFWSYGDNALMFMGMPADIWFAGALLFGPAIFFALPNLNPWILTLGCVALQAVMFQSLYPFVIAGDGWFIGVLLVFLFVHVPALFLARWTARDTCLPERASLLAFGFGLIAYFVLPSIIMKAMGGGWNIDKASWIGLSFSALMLVPCITMGLSATQMFVIHGEGTPIPLDKTKHLVRSGLYGYIRNPMQCATALSWIVLGLFLQNLFVILAAAMALIFVLGMVRWHHRVDLCVRFPEGWPEYREHVPEWFPRWKPWVKHTSILQYNPTNFFQNKFGHWLSQQSLTGLILEQSSQKCLQYRDGNSGKSFKGIAAGACALFHINFTMALVGSMLLLLFLPIQWGAHKIASLKRLSHE